MSGRPHSEGEEFNLHNLEHLRGDVLFVDLRSTDLGSIPCDGGCFAKGFGKSFS